MEEQLSAHQFNILNFLDDTPLKINALFFILVFLSRTLKLSPVLHYCIYRLHILILTSIAMAKLSALTDLTFKLSRSNLVFRIQEM